MKIFARSAVALSVTGAAIALSCAEAGSVGTYVSNRTAEDGGPGLSFVNEEPDAESAEASQTRALCAATECPWPWETCTADPLGDKCTTNLSNDPNNCGACGNRCPSDDELFYLHMTSTCVDGACTNRCRTITTFTGASWTFGDCNGIPDDGCETIIAETGGNDLDKNNCGACGNKCDPFVPCLPPGECGISGCPIGTTVCNGRCVDLKIDSQNCGECENRCPTNAHVPPPHSEIAFCADGKCQFSPYCSAGWEDCNNNLSLTSPSDGCEVYIGLKQINLFDYSRHGADPDNCGGCGIKCRTDQVCFDLDDDFLPECICGSTEALCGDRDSEKITCANLLTDPENCGDCFNKCTVPFGSNRISSCQKGLCVSECADGWGDCDGNPDNGCETNLRTSGANCGACGRRCDTQAGQPCIEGVCAMKDCDAGIVVQ